MKEISRRLRKLEASHIAQRNEHGLNPADMFRQRMWHQAAETGRPIAPLGEPDKLSLARVFERPARRRLRAGLLSCPFQLGELFP